MTNHALILFDIDGTLLKAGDRAHAEALLDAYRRVFDLEPDLDGVTLAGMLDAQIVRHMLEKQGVDLDVAEEKLSDVMHAMGEHYANVMKGRTLHDRLLPGVTATVTTIERHGYLLGTLTGNARTVGEAKLRAAGLEQLTRIGAYGDSAFERHELVAIALDNASRLSGVSLVSSRVVLIGDTPQDIAAARASGSGVIAVATGRYDTDELESHAPDAVVPDLRDSESIAEIAREILSEPLDDDAKEWKAAR